MKLLNNLKNKSLGGILPLILLISWQIATRLGLFPSTLIVPPKQVIFTFADLLKNGDLIGHLKISLIRVIAGFLVGSLTGFVLGTAMGLSKSIERYVGPLFHSIRQVPLLGWMPLLMLWLGIGEAFKIIFVAIAPFYILTLNTLEGIKGVPSEYVELAQVFEYNKVKLLRKVILPAALPSILTGIRLGLSMSWMTIIGAELIASESGIGYMMTWGRQLFQLDVVMVGVIVIGIIGLIMNNIMGPVESYFLRWRRTF
jgi:sulfonate transport system permease protein